MPDYREKERAKGSHLAVREEAVKGLLSGKHGASIIQLACHGRFSPDDPSKAALLLSRNGSDGVLTVDEIEKLPMHSVDLVFLSCCYSGLGSRLAGDEVEGIARAFLSAGAKSVIVTHWDIEDKVTSEMVVSFYRGIRAGSPKAAALRQSQLEGLTEHTNPYHWVAFQLLGNAV